MPPRVAKAARAVRKATPAARAPRVSAETKKRIERAISQRMFLVARSDGEDMLDRGYSVLGSTGNLYEVRITHNPSCTCPDAARGNRCKHIIFILVRVLGQSQQSPLAVADELSDEELVLIFSEADARGAGVAAAVQAGDEVVVAVTGKAPAAAAAAAAAADEPKPVAKPAEGDCCICFEGLLTGHADPASLCACSVCQNSLHKDCIAAWLTRGTACPYCRSPWLAFGEAPVDAAARPKFQDGYRNFADAAGLDSRRQGWRYGGGGGGRGGFYDDDDDDDGDGSGDGSGGDY